MCTCTCDPADVCPINEFELQFIRTAGLPFCSISDDAYYKYHTSTDILKLLWKLQHEFEAAPELLLLALKEL